MQAFRAGGRAWATQFHPEVDAAMAPHWVEDAAKEHHEQGKGWIERLHADTEAYLPAYPSFCRTLTENFVLTSGLVAAGRAALERRTAALSRRRPHPFPGSPSGRGACERSHGVVLGGTSTVEGCVEGDSSVHNVYYHRHNS